jgi:ABC-type Fe3+-hydroxamate transport system substrate-binding protein
VAPIAVTDDAGRQVTLDAPPARIVSLVPSLTELLYALGVGAAVVGVTRYCTHPTEAVARLPRLGGTKNPDLDGIRRLVPDLILMNAEENRREDFEAMAHDLPVFVTEPKTVDDGIALIARLAVLVGCAGAGEAMAAAQGAAVAATAAGAARGRLVRYFCPIWKRPWMAFNADTYAHDLLRRAGGENVLGARPDRYPTVTLDEVAAAAPEVVLLPDEPYAFAAGDVAALAPLGDTPALVAGRVHLVDGKALAWYGPRIADGVRTFAALFAAAR